MDKKEEFKSFVRKHPKLVTYIKDGKTTWQKFYEMFDLYGEDSEVWNDYLETGNNNIGKINDLIKMTSELTKRANECYFCHILWIRKIYKLNCNCKNIFF